MAQLVIGLLIRDYLAQGGERENAAAAIDWLTDAQAGMFASIAGLPVSQARPDG